MGVNVCPVCWPYNALVPVITFHLTLFRVTGTRTKTQGAENFVKGFVDYCISKY